MINKTTKYRKYIEIVYKNEEDYQHIVLFFKDIQIISEEYEYCAIYPGWKRLIPFLNSRKFMTSTTGDMDVLCGVDDYVSIIW